MKRSWPALILSLLLFMAIPVAAVVVAAMVSSNWWLLALVPVLVLLTHRFTDRGYAWFASRLSKG